MGLENELRSTKVGTEKFSYRLEVCSIKSDMERDNWFAVINQYYDKIGRMPDVLKRKNEIFRFLDKGNVIVVFYRKEIVALANVYCNNYDTLEGYVNNCEVVKEHRRRGLMRRIMQRAIEICVERGFQSIFLHIAEGNVIAESLYVQLGFQRTGNCKETAEGLLYEMKLIL